MTHGHRDRDYSLHPSRSLVKSSSRVSLSPYKDSSIRYIKYYY